MAPERDASRVASSALALEGPPAMAIDGTERRRQRPPNAAQQQEQYRGTKQTHPDKPILLVNAPPQSRLSRADRGRENARQESGR
jgi:hypothetical protein